MIAHVCACVVCFSWRPHQPHQRGQFACLDARSDDLEAVVRIHHLDDRHRTHQEEDDLEVPVHHYQPDVAPEGEGPDQLGNLVVKEKLEEQIHDQESQDHKDEVQSQVVVAVRQQVFPFAFVMNELRL